MFLNSNVRRKTFNVTLLTASAPATRTFTFTSDNDMRIIRGIAVYINRRGGFTAAQIIKIGIMSSPGGAVVQDPTSEKDWTCADNVPVNERYKMLGDSKDGIQAQGQQYTITLITPVETTDTLDIDFVFHQEK